MNQQAISSSTIARRIARMLLIAVVVAIFCIVTPLLVRAATIYKSGTITSDETWTSDNVYVVNGDLTINSGVTVTVQAGTVVKLEGYNTDIIVNGVLDAQGTVADPVVFTSYRDDVYGGDTNGDGGATSPSPYDWGTIQINNSANTLQYAHIRYGGYGAVYINSSATIAHNIFDYNYYAISSASDDPAIEYNEVSHSSQAGIYVTGGSPTIAHNILEYNDYYGIQFASDDATIEYNQVSHASNTGIYVTAGSPTIAHNAVTTNTNGLVMSNASPVVISNTITANTEFPLGVWGTSNPTFSGNTISGNGYQAVSVQGIIDADTTWQNVQGLDLVYWAIAGVTVNAGVIPYPDPRLIIPAGTVVKLEGYNTDIIVNGVLDAQGTVADPVVFTSYRDDVYGGDTNGDGGATSPSPGNWGRIQFANPSAHSTLQYVVARYGGHGGSMVRSNGAYLTVQHALLEYSSGDGLYIYYESSDPDVTVQYCTFRNNNGSGVHVVGP